MANNKFQIIDGSSDRKYFTIIPNYILDHSTPYDRCLYIEMKRIAGETGSCWASTWRLGELAKMSQTQVRKSLNCLLKKNWIVKVGERRGNGGISNVYKIVDIWQINNEFYSDKNKVSIENSPSKGEHQMLRGEHTMLGGEHQVAPNKINEEDIKNKNTQHSFDYLKNLKNNPQDIAELVDRYGVTIQSILDRAEDVIDYCQAKGKTYKNYNAALRNFIKNHLRDHPELARPRMSEQQIKDNQTEMKRLEDMEKPRTPEEQDRINKQMAEIKSNLAEKLAWPKK